MLKAAYSLNSFSYKLSFAQRGIQETLSVIHRVKSCCFLVKSFMSLFTLVNKWLCSELFYNLFPSVALFNLLLHRLWSAFLLKASLLVILWFNQRRRREKPVWHVTSASFTFTKEEWITWEKTSDVYLTDELPEFSSSRSPCSGTSSPSGEIPEGKLLRPSIVIQKGPRGYGFTLRAIRVYCGYSEYYTIHHLVVVSLCTSCCTELYL